jgi:hypothetical protein
MVPATKKAPTKRKAKKPAPRKAAPKTVQVEKKLLVEEDYNSPQWAATVEAYTALKNAGLDVPAEIAVPVEVWLKVENARIDAEQSAQEGENEAIKKADENGTKWIRNCFNGPFNLRLQRQDKKQRIELKPRGLRGDMFPLEPGDESDHILITNLQQGLIELIGDGTARKVTEGQTHNIQKTNTTLALIRNENDEPIKKLTVAQEYNSQGVVVGYIDPNQQAKIEKGEFGKSRSQLGDLARQPEQVSQFVPTGGNPAIVSSGYVQQSAPGLTNDATLAIQDQLARIKGTQGRPEEVLGLSVSVEPTRSA